MACGGFFIYFAITTNKEVSVLEYVIFILCFIAGFCMFLSSFDKDPTGGYITELEQQKDEI
jgi:hypothetical protein